MKLVHGHGFCQQRSVELNISQTALRCTCNATESYRRLKVTVMHLRLALSC